MSKRVSLILRAADEAAIAPFLDPENPSFDTLRRWVRDRGDLEVRSEAAALRALLQAGAEMLGEQALEAGYRQFAEEFNADHADAERRAARSRYARRTDAHQ